MKKGIALLLTLAMTASMVASGSKQETTETPVQSEETKEEAAEETAEAAESTSAEGIPASVTLSDSKVLQGKRLAALSAIRVMSGVQESQMHWKNWVHTMAVKS